MLTIIYETGSNLAGSKRNCVNYSTVIVCHSSARNSLPPTTTVENFRKKQEAAAGKTHVNVGFWGGIIPGNSPELKPLLEEGVVGFKCFLCQSGVDEFPAVDRRDVELAYQQLNGMHALIAVCSASLNVAIVRCQAFVRTSVSVPRRNVR